MPLTPGDPAPWFRGATPSNPEFTFDAVAGRYILLAFLPIGDAPRLEMLKALAAHQRMFDDARLACFAVVADAQTAAGVRDMTGLRWILDVSGEVAALYAGTDAAPPSWLLLDPTLRVMAVAGAAETEELFRRLADLPSPALHGGVATPAPVLILPRVFEPELCRRLVALHQEGAAERTGVMRDRGERTEHVLDDLKSRRDVLVRDAGLQAEIRARLETRLFPMIQRVFMAKPTRIERYLVSCYAADEGGVFHAHRDNTTLQTAHRLFAASINLNDDFEGGDLRFPEFGREVLRPPLGGACVFGCGLLHEATRVTAGRRYAFLPFFYDEAGAAALAAYEASAGQPAA